MTAQLSPTTLAVSAFAVAIVGFAGGVAISTAFARPAETAPIIDENAWNETAPAQPVSYTPTVQPRCNPWEISDAAMEEVLDQMIRRGWRAPTQGAAVSLLDTQVMQAIDPNAPMPSRRAWSPSDESPDETTAEDEVEEATTPEPLPAELTKTEPPPV